MKQQTINQIRNYSHTVIGFTVTYWAFSHLNNDDFWLWQRLLMYFLLGTALGGAIGFVWEGFMDIVFKEPSDMMDVIRTAIGGLIGGTLCFWKQDIYFITNVLFWICLAIGSADVVRAIIKSNLKK